MDPVYAVNPPADKRRVAQVFMLFLKLGLTSFGGPVAHVGYFRAELIEKRRWLGDQQFAQLLAICQFLPGPASSQLGFCLGLLRAGWLGALAAFVAFTAPSVVVLVGFATLLPYVADPAGAAAIHGLKLVALVVVAQGVLGMSRQLCPDLPRAAIALAAAVLILIAGSVAVQLLVVAAGALAGVLCLRGLSPVAAAPLTVNYGVRRGGALLAGFVLLLVGLPLLAEWVPAQIKVMDAFYRAGALVFGGGHVVLPLLEEAVVAPGWVKPEVFLAGYGAAQAVPGPMFSLAAYLGAVLEGDRGGLLGATTALLSMFLPGFLLVAGVLPFWQRLLTGVWAARAIAGVNAAVVGLLAAALYDPVFTQAVTGPWELAIGLVGLALLATGRASVLVVVGWCVGASVLAAGLFAAPFPYHMW